MASGAVELARLYPGKVFGRGRPGVAAEEQTQEAAPAERGCAMSSRARRGLPYQAVGEKETQGGRS
jgi:hypothetical protein